MECRHASRTRPIAIVPGLNHAQQSNGVVNAARGDVAAEQPHSVGAAAIAALIADFITANHHHNTVNSKELQAPAAEAAAASIDRLQQATATAMELLSPYSEAAGRGPLTGAFNGIRADSTACPPDLRYWYCHGAERLPASCSVRTSVLHPGEMAAAERFCEAAQRRALAAGGLTAEQASSVVVITTVHSQLESFIYSQPTVYQIESDLESGEHRKAPPVGLFLSSCVIEGLLYACM
jgi:hypothetical protein